LSFKENEAAELEETALNFKKHAKQLKKKSVSLICLACAIRAAELIGLQESSCSLELHDHPHRGRQQHP